MTLAAGFDRGLGWEGHPGKYKYRQSQELHNYTLNGCQGRPFLFENTLQGRLLRNFSELCLCNTDVSVFLGISQ